MKDAVLALFSSRKFLLVALVAIIGAVLVALGKLPLADYSKFVAGASMVLVAAIAHEDAAEKSRPAQTAGGDIVTVNPAGDRVTPNVPGTVEKPQ